jgi:hypothetical protein
MKPIAAVLSVIAVILATASSGSARERAYKPHSQVNDPQLVLQLRQQMALMENGFSGIEDHFTGSNVDYDAILKAVSQMEATGRTLRKVVPDKEWNEPLAGLNTQLAKVRKAAGRQDPITLRKQVDALYDSCFRCHAANAPQGNY